MEIKTALKPHSPRRMKGKPERPHSRNVLRSIFAMPGFLSSISGIKSVARHNYPATFQLNEIFLSQLGNLTPIPSPRF